MRAPVFAFFLWISSISMVALGLQMLFEGLTENDLIVVFSASVILLPAIGAVALTILTD